MKEVGWNLSHSGCPSGQGVVGKSPFFARRKSWIQGVRFPNWNMGLNCALWQFFFSCFAFYGMLLIYLNNLGDPLQIIQSCTFVSLWTNTIKLSDAASDKCILLQEEKQTGVLRGNTFLRPDKCFLVVCLPVGSVNTLYGLRQPVPHWLLSKSTVF